MTGSSWAPASLVAADPLHLDVFSNGPTTKVVGPSNQFGLKWQCTELAVRWAAAAWGEGNKKTWDLAGWNGAAQGMWGVGPHLPKPLQQVPNGASQAPQMGDLLIFHEPKGVAGPGHVAIVLSVNRSTGKLTFIGENQYRAPAVFHVPISPTNQVSATGFSKTLIVKGWLSPGHTSLGWTAEEAPLPANADPTLPGPFLGAVACASASACTAVGYYTDTSGHDRGLLVSGSGSTWTAAQAPLPANADTSSDGYLTAVACPPTAGCTAVGSYKDASMTWHVLLVSESGSTWTAAQAPLPANADTSSDAQLTAVACPPTAGCTAVGYYTDTSGHQRGLLMSGSGSTWTVTEAPLPANVGGATLTAVACPSTSACTAVGTFNSEEGLLLVHGSGSTWTAVKGPLPGNAGSPPSVTPEGVACSSASACTAVGGYTNTSGGYPGFLIKGSGGTWTATEAPLPPDAYSQPTVNLQVACPSTCVAAGNYDDTSHNLQGLLATESGSTWKGVKAPFPADAGSDPFVQLPGVACASAGLCVAAGSYSTAGPQRGLLEVQSGTAWTAIKAPLPANANPNGVAFLSGIACPSNSMCVAVGAYGDTHPSLQGLLVTGSGS